MGDGLTKAQQQAAVGDGIAVACLAVGVLGVTSGRQALQAAFRRAWSDWPQASGFQQVHASFDRNDIERIFTKSANRTTGHVAYWTSGRFFEPHLLGDDWTIEEAAERVESLSGVPFPAWLDLTAAFIDYFKPEELQWGP